MNLSELIKKQSVQTLVRDAKQADVFSAALQRLIESGHGMSEDKNLIKSIVHDEARRYALGSKSVGQARRVFELFGLLIAVTEVRPISGSLAERYYEIISLL